MVQSLLQKKKRKKKRENQGKVLNKTHEADNTSHNLFFSFTSLSAKCLSPLRHSEVLLRVFSSPSSKTAMKKTNFEMQMTSLVYWRTIIRPKSGPISAILGRFSQPYLYVPTVYQLASVSLLMTASLSPPSGLFTSTVEPTWDQRYRTHHCTT